MNTNYYYSSMENFDELMYISTSMRAMYDCFLCLPDLEEWERKSFEDLILSEKVFDV